jgi:hypothetical protein
MRITFFPQDHRQDLTIVIEKGALTIRGPAGEANELVTVSIQLSPQKQAELTDCMNFLLAHTEIGE